MREWVKCWSDKQSWRWGKMLKVTFISFRPPLQLYPLTSGDDPSSLTSFILSSLLFFHPVGRLPYLLTPDILLVALSGCKLIVNNDIGKIIHCSPSLTVLWKKRFWLPSYHQPKGRNPWELWNIEVLALKSCISQKGIFILKEEIKDRISLYRHSLLLFRECTLTLFYCWIPIS